MKADEWISRPLNDSTGPHGPLDLCPTWTAAVILFRQIVRTMMAQPEPPPPKKLYVEETAA